MRTVSFSHPAVQKTLDQDFVSTFTDTTGDPTAGASFKHSPRDNAGPCGKGAGRQNVQTIFMTPDQEIFHVTTGFLSGEDLAKELQFAKTTFDKMQKNPRSQKEVCSQMQVARLKQLGFKESEIGQPENMLTQHFLGGPNPNDFGMKFPGNQSGRSNSAAGIFDQINRQRTLKDANYVIAQPLRPRQSFEQDPGQLVGRGKSFFGTNSSMNGLNGSNGLQGLKDLQGMKDLNKLFDRR